MRVTKTYQELNTFSIIAAIYVRDQAIVNKEHENKLVQAIKLIAKQLKPIFENYEDEKDTLQLNNCLVDEKTKAVLYDDVTVGNEVRRLRKFTAAGEIKLKKEIKLLDLTEVEVHPRILEGIDDLILTLSEQQLVAFSGLIIPEIKEH